MFLVFCFVLTVPFILFRQMYKCFTLLLLLLLRIWCIKSPFLLAFQAWVGCSSVPSSITSKRNKVVLELDPHTCLSSFPHSFPPWCGGYALLWGAAPAASLHVLNPDLSWIWLLPPPVLVTPWDGCWAPTNEFKLPPIWFILVSSIGDWGGLPIICGEWQLALQIQGLHTGVSFLRPAGLWQGCKIC